MKVIINGEEIEFDGTVEKGEEELDLVATTIPLSDLENTIEVTDEMIEQIREESHE